MAIRNSDVTIHTDEALDNAKLEVLRVYAELSGLLLESRALCVKPQPQFYILESCV